MSVRIPFLTIRPSLLRARTALVAGLALLTPAIGPEAGAQADPPTYTRDIAPILYRNCTTCHRPGGLGPMSLLTYADARKSAAEISEAVGSGFMPPWHADAPHGTFVNDRRLSTPEKQAIARWIAAGTPDGDPKDLTPAPVYTDRWSVGTPDAIMTMPDSYEVPATGVVEYQYFEVPTNFTEDKWVQAIEILPGARDVVHHVLVYARPPAAAPATPPPPGTPRPRPVLIHREDHGIPDPPASPNGAQQPNRRLGALIGSTAPGTNVLTLPEGTALRVRAGSILTFQMHYTPHGHAMKDRTSVGMVFAKAPPAEEMRAASFVNGMFAIPPGATDFTVPSEIAFRESVRVWGMLPHTHLRGKRWEYRLVQPDGRSEMILSVPNYDFNWQTYYLFAKPVEVKPGAKIEALAWYDNSTANRANPDPKKEVRWGDQTWEEMQYTGFLFTIDSRRLAPAPARP
jgi:mono/diheme cytochrome c family protein